MVWDITLVEDRVECKVEVSTVKHRAISNTMVNNNLAEVTEEEVNTITGEEVTEEEANTITEEETKDTTKASTIKEVEVTNRIEVTPTNSRTTCNKWVVCQDSSKCRIKDLNSKWARLMVTNSSRS